MGRGTKGMVLTLLLRDQETSEPFRLPDWLKEIDQWKRGKAVKKLWRGFRTNPLN
jgi:hypothetical protein